jgi:hypothetical protein
MALNYRTMDNSTRKKGIKRKRLSNLVEMGNPTFRESSDHKPKWALGFGVAI